MAGDFPPPARRRRDKISLNGIDSNRLTTFRCNHKPRRGSPSKMVFAVPQCAGVMDHVLDANVF